MVAGFGCTRSCAGGVYVDASELCLQPLDQWINPLLRRSTGFVGSREWATYRLLEATNFMAAAVSNLVSSGVKVGGYAHKPLLLERARHLAKVCDVSELKSLLDDGLISKDEFDVKRREILSGL